MVKEQASMKLLEKMKELYNLKYRVKYKTKLSYCLECKKLQKAEVQEF